MWDCESFPEDYRGKNKKKKSCFSEQDQGQGKIDGVEITDFEGGKKIRILNQRPGIQTIVI